MTDGYDPYPDLAELLSMIYTGLMRENYSRTRGAMRALRDGLGVEHKHATMALTWLERLRRADETALAETRAELARLQADMDAVRPGSVHLVPQGITQEVAYQHLAGAVRHGDKIRFLVDGREQVYTERGWVDPRD